MVHLDELERDVLLETFNIGVGRAAASLSELLGAEIHIAIPNLEILPKRQAIDLLGCRFSPSARTIQQAFQGVAESDKLAGYAFFLLPEQASSALVQTLTGTPEDAPSFAEIEREVLNELGNIVLNACLGALANMIDAELDCAIPEVRDVNVFPVLLEIVRTPSFNHDAFHPISPDEGINRRRKEGEQDPVLYMAIRMEAKEVPIDGHLMLFLELTALPHLKSELRSVIVRYTVQEKSS